MAIDLLTITATASGSAGTSTGSAASSTQAIGRVIAVYVDESAASTAIDVTLAATNTPSENILNLTNVTADAWVYPRRQVHSNAAAGLEYATGFNVCEPYVVHDTLTLSLAEANDADAVTVYVFVET